MMQGKPWVIRLPRRRGLLALVIPAGIIYFFGRTFVGDLYYQNAMALKQEIYLDAAAASLRRASAWQPGNALYYRELGRTYMAMSPWRLDRMRWIEQAIAAYERARSLNPHDSATFFDLGMAYVAARKMDEAEATFLSGLKVDPNNSAFYVALGAVYEFQQKFSDARAALERALALSAYDQVLIRDQLRSLDQAATLLHK